MKISVIVPVYATNGILAQYFRECLESCAAADEIVVWDDGSTVDAESIARQFNNVIYERDRHVGKSYARNNAVRMSSGELILPVDADDTVVPRIFDVFRSEWNGTPLYSNLIKVHPDGAEEMFELLPFDCDAILDKCITPVNVLHHKSQWQATGGWNESLNLYEDWEYNARLMTMYCGRRISAYLIKYRQHPGQSTSVEISIRQSAYNQVKHIINDNVGRSNKMACCSGKRTAGSGRSGGMVNTLNQQTPVVQQVGVSLDMSQDVLGDPGSGNVWAMYVGGRGMGPHKRVGMRTRKVYKSIMYGERYAVKAEDAVSREDFERGVPNCGFVAIHVIMPVSRPAPVATAPVEVARTPSIADVVREPIVPPEISAELEKLRSDIKSISVRELKGVLEAITSLTVEDVNGLIVAEEAGGNRIVVKKMLEKKLNELMTKG